MQRFSLDLKHENIPIIDHTSSPKRKSHESFHPQWKLFFFHNFWLRGKGKRFFGCFFFFVINILNVTRTRGKIPNPFSASEEHMWIPHCIEMNLFWFFYSTWQRLHPTSSSEFLFQNFYRLMSGLGLVYSHRTETLLQDRDSDKMSGTPLNYWDLFSRKDQWQSVSFT